MIYENHRLAIPSHSEYSVPQLKIMLDEVEKILQRKITYEEWNSLR
jgi:hypothetical protein